MLDYGALKIIKELNKRGFQAYIVGGAVRDILLNKEVDDYDISTNAFPEVVMNLPFKVIPSGIEHGSVTILIDSKKYEITTFRVEPLYLDHRHPANITFSNSLSEDLERRDFTINALALDYNALALDCNALDVNVNYEDCIIDIFGGINDLNNKVIKCIGDPQIRFEEDALRIFRALRFTSTLDFKIEDRTLRAIKEKYLNLKYVSKERANPEISKMICGVGFSKVLNDYQEELSYYFDIIIDNNTILKVNNSTQKLSIRLGLLFYKDHNPFQKMIELKFTKRLSKIVNDYIYLSKKLLNDRFDAYNVIKTITLDNASEYLEFLKIIDYDKNSYAILLEAIEMFESNKLPLSLRQLEIKGHDVVALGFKGKHIKEVLEKLHKMVILEQLKNENNILINEAQKLLNNYHL